jgi:hypothetical protein
MQLSVLAKMPWNVAAVEEPRFQALAEDYAAKAEIVAQLDRIILIDLKFENKTLDEAIAMIREKSEDNKWATISFVIRKPRTTTTVPAFDDDPFAKNEEENPKAVEEKKLEISERISLSVAKISFAQAVDQLCKKTGHCWSIEGGGDAVPVLVIKPVER